MTLEFEELASMREELREFVLGHGVSVWHFWDENNKMFRSHEGDTSTSDPSERSVRRLTTTFSCIESLLEAAPSESRARAQTLLDDYAPLALAHGGDWLSEGSAWVYCRARSLGMLARYGRQYVLNDDDSKANARRLSQQVWDSKDKATGSFGIHESTVDPFGEPDGKAERGGYPANAYLTFWAMQWLRRMQNESGGSVVPEEAVVYFEGARDWLFQSLSEQVSFQASGSVHGDPQQLAWSISGIVLTAEAKDLVPGARTHDLVEEGIKAFFAQQNPRGDWERGQPLFNYRHAGNAYCYTFETLAELLAIATDPTVKAQIGFQKMLEPYVSALYQAFSYANKTGVALNGDPRSKGWASGHHPHRTQPESWATASVYRFAQRLRVLTGVWTRGRALDLLGGRQAQATIATLEQRGGTWDLGKGSAGTQLACYYLNPALARQSDEGVGYMIPDPDEVVIKSGEGRSAMLFGPPGTGKTTLVEAMAGALSWPFVEVTPAQFLDKGLDLVSSRADEIFRQMMELDRCVVLLDEIDELVQDRSSGKEQLERFFTTTMLPRLAKLWSGGRILFFANTNDVDRVDFAIRRSQRFDSAILVMPPGLDAKESLLRSYGVELTDDLRAKLRKGSAENVANRTDEEAESPEKPISILWLALTKFEQLETLGRTLRRNAGKQPSVVDEEALRVGLEDVRGELLNQDWASSATKPLDSMLAPLRSAQRRDSRLQPVVRGSSEKLSDLAGQETIEEKTRGYFVIDAGTADLEDWARSHDVVMNHAGQVSDS